jgi:hypothetical protein
VAVVAAAADSHTAWACHDHRRAAGLHNRTCRRRHVQTEVVVVEAASCVEAAVHRHWHWDPAVVVATTNRA